MSANDDLKEKKFTRVVDGHELTARVSPCVWMYQGYGLQIEVVLQNGGSVILNDKNVLWGEISDEHINSLLNQVGLCKCGNAGCKNMAFDPATASTNRAGTCESCFMAKLNAEFAKAQEKEAKKEAVRDAKMKAKGFTHKVVAWVHPPRGDDYQMIMHTMGQPSDADIKKELKKARSKIDTDYKVTEL